MAARKPEDDFASLVSAAITGGKSQPHPATATATTTTTTNPDPDFPAESFRLPPEAELDWLDRSVAAAAIYERDDSTKGTANPKAQQHQHHQQQHQPSHGSNRFSGPLKPRKSAILGLPKPVERHSGYLSGPRKAGKNVRIFPKKKGGGRGGGGKGKAVEEPGSPKVSCFGKVRSERERCREQKEQQRQWKQEFDALDSRAPRGEGGGAGGFWSCLLGPLACCRGNPAVGSAEEDADRRTPSSLSSSDNNSNWKKKNKSKEDKRQRRAFPGPFSAAATDRGDDNDDAASPRSSSATADAPGLGGLKRFASGRRPSSWGGGEFEGHGLDGAVHADASPGPVDPGRRSVS